jgi:hypothetical protein
VTPDSAARAPVLLDMLPTRSREIILSNMRKASSLTLWVVKSLYPPPPRDDLDMDGEGFVVTCTKEEVSKLAEDFTVTATRLIEMLSVNMS